MKLNGNIGLSFSSQSLFVGGMVLFSVYCYLYYVHLLSKSRDLRLKTEETDIKSSRSLPDCPRHPPGLTGKIFVNFTEPISFDDIPAVHSSTPPLQLGGRWQPSNCTSRSRLAVVMTYRDRPRNVKLILQHLHPFLQKQLIQYQIFLIEPPTDVQFNRGLLKNIGFVESAKYDDFQCVVFHDIDLLPEDDRNLYHCTNQPRHLVVSIDTREYKPLRGGAVFGGAVLFRKDHFNLTNGYSNYYFGWGGEDDDLLSRVRYHGLNINRPHPIIGRYKEAVHKKEIRGATTRAMYNIRAQRFDEDGLNSLKYQITDVRLHKAYTWIHVGYDEGFYRNLSAVAAARARAKKKELKEEKTNESRRQNHTEPSNTTNSTVHVI